MKRVLMIAYFFPPLADSGTQRPLKFSKYLPEYGWEPLVLTVDRAPNAARDPGLEREIRPGTRIERVPMLSDTIGDGVGTLLPVRVRDRVSGAISWRLRERFRRPDLYALWRPPARRAALRLFRDVGFDAVWATGYPYTSLVIGRDVARLTKRPFIADFRDPWTGDDVFRPPNSKREADRDLELERSVVKEATFVPSVSEQMTLLMREIHSKEDPDKFVTITNGFDSDDAKSIERVPAAAAGVFRIVFTGVWRPGYGPSMLYDAIERLASADRDAIRNLEVIAAGFEPGEAARRGLSPYIRELGRISFGEAQSWMQTAGALFVSVAGGTFEKLALPGKLFEYLASGRPVIAMTNPHGDAAHLLNEVGGGIVIPPDDLNGVAATLVRGCAAGRLDPPPRNPSALSRYERRNLTAKLADVLTRATINPKRAS